MRNIINLIKSLFLKHEKPCFPHADDEPLSKTKPDEDLPTMYIDDGNVIYKPNGGIITDDEIPYLMETSMQDAMKFYADRDAMLGRTSETEKLSSQFYHANLDQLNYLDSIFMDIHLHQDDPPQALNALYEIKDFCFQHGEPGIIYYKQHYEQLFNSKNPCFSFEEIILEAVEKEKVFKPIREYLYPEILQIFNENGSVLQNDLYARYTDVEKTVARRIIYRLFVDKHIIKSKQGRYRVLTMESAVSRELLDKHSETLQ